MSDGALSYMEKQLRLKLAQRLGATSPIGVRLREQYQDKLDEVRLEIERRACD